MLKKVLIGVVAVVGAMLAIVVVGGLMMDGKIELATVQRLKATPEQAYPLLSSASGLDKWWKNAQASTPDAPKMLVKKKSGPDEGAGLVVTFEGEDGSVFETWTVREAVPPSRVVYDVDFAGMMTVRRTIELVPGSFGGCDAQWKETGEIGNPVFRWMKKLMSSDEVIKNFDGALKALDGAATTTTTD